MCKPTNVNSASNALNKWLHANFRKNIVVLSNVHQTSSTR